MQCKHISKSTNKQCEKESIKDQDFCFLHKEEFTKNDLLLMAKNRTKRDILPIDATEKLIEEYIPKIKKWVLESGANPENKQMLEYYNKNQDELISKIVQRILRGEIWQNHESYKKLEKKLKRKQSNTAYRLKADQKDNEDKRIKYFLEKISRTNSLETGLALSESVWDYFKSFALDMREKLIKEYSCTSPLEISLIDSIVNAHINKLTASMRMQTLYTKDWDYYGKERINMLNFMSKEIERYHNQYISSLQTLIRLKQPSLNVEINTNNAFISQNQQINNNKENNESN